VLPQELSRPLASLFNPLQEVAGAEHPEPRPALLAVVQYEYSCDVLVHGLESDLPSVEPLSYAVEKLGQTHGRP
jgi:hypothetical protein